MIEEFTLEGTLEGRIRKLDDEIKEVTIENKKYYCIRALIEQDNTIYLVKFLRDFDEDNKMIIEEEYSKLHVLDKIKLKIKYIAKNDVYYAHGPITIIERYSPSPPDMY